ncbi:MAG TPA: two-component regulator propeller domain-containing protein [Paludibacter sp.]
MNSYLKYISLLLMPLVCLFFGCKSEEPTDISVLPSNIITKIVIDNYGIKWIATDKGLVSFNGKIWKVYPNVKQLSNQPINDLCFDVMSENRQIWAASFGGAVKGSIASQTYLLTDNYHLDSNGLLSDTVFSVATDNNNTKFFGTPNGLSILKNAIWSSYDGTWGKRKDNFLVTNIITAIAVAKDGWNYVSSQGGGVSRFQFTDAVSGATKFFMPWAYGLKSDNVNTVVVVNDTCQWYGTDKGAAYHTSYNTKADWTSYSSVDGLVSDTVYAIAQGLSGETWFGTHRGVSRLYADVWTSYTTQDGLIANKVNTLAIDIDGSVWFGTDMGLSHLINGVWTSYNKK